MQCPECDYPLFTLELNNIEIDYCQKCEGVWLDSGELELLSGITDGISSIFEEVTDLEEIDEAKIKCPICSKKMFKVRFDAAGKIILDKCRLGDGFWLNKGELESVLSYSDDSDKIVAVLRDIFNHEDKS